MTATSDGALGAAARRRFEESLPVLGTYVSIACLSPAFDPDWAQTGAIARAAALVESHLRDELPHASVETLEIDGRTPIVVADVRATPGAEARGTTLVYGHFDKQPPLGAWRDGLEPFRAVREGDRLYGRGAADDGYAAFCAAAAVGALEELGAAHGRVVVLLEASEESGSPDLVSYLELLAGRLGTLALVVCLDSGCATYDRLWVTTSLRGNLTATLRVAVLEYGVHSGMAGGIVPSSFRIARALLSRIEDEDTGELRLAHAHPEVPEHRRAEMAEAAELVGFDVAGEFPAVTGLRLAGSDPAERLERSTWHPALAVTGAAGLPAIADAGNVLRPATALRLSLRLPPTADAEVVAAELSEALTSSPPDGARVSLEIDPPGSGWEAPQSAAWLADALEAASVAAFGAPPRFSGLGGSIPFLASLAQRNPSAQFLATGVLGPGSNAHGPNESLHVPTAGALSSVVATVLAAVP